MLNLIAGDYIDALLKHFFLFLLDIYKFFFVCVKKKKLIYLGILSWIGFKELPCFPWSSARI